MTETSLDDRSRKLRLIARGLLGPVLVSLIGAIYSGVKVVPYWLVIWWALVNVAIVLWSGRSALRKMWGRQNVPPVTKLVGILLFITATITVFVASNFTVYLLARRFFE